MKEKKSIPTPGLNWTAGHLHESIVLYHAGMDFLSHQLSFTVLKIYSIRIIND